MSTLQQILRTEAKLYLIYVNFAPDMEKTSQIILDMSFLYKIWRTQTTLYLIYFNFAPDMENISQIIFDICQFCTRYWEHKPNYTWCMSIVHQIWRTQAKLNLIYANCAPDMENTSQIKLDICQLCTRYGEHKLN